jgi:nucleoside-diphosphate-sugar epimerase
LKTLLIIGGSGFLGSSFLDYANHYSFLKWKINKIIFLSRKGKKNKNLNKKKVSFSFIKKNVLKLKKLPYCDYVIYAANSKNNKENLKGLLKFNKLLKKTPHKVKILFTSSGAVYGPRNKKKKISEKDLISIKKIDSFNNYKKEYAKTKMNMEKLIENLGKDGFNVSIARLFSFFGYRLLHNNKYAISDMINSASKKKLIKIESKYPVYRSYMCSKDLIEWLFAVLISSNKACPIYNVGSDQPLTTHQLAHLLSRILSVNVIKNSIPKTIIDYYVPSVQKIKKNLKVKIKQNFILELEKTLK